MSERKSSDAGTASRHVKMAIALLLMAVLLVGESDVCRAEPSAICETPVIGIAWRADTDSEFSPMSAVPSKRRAGPGSCWTRSAQRTCAMTAKGG